MMKLEFNGVFYEYEFSVQTYLLNQRRKAFYVLTGLHLNARGINKLMHRFISKLNRL